MEHQLQEQVEVHQDQMVLVVLVVEEMLEQVVEQLILVVEVLVTEDLLQDRLVEQVDQV